MIKTSRNALRLHRKKRIAAKIRGKADRPRLAVFKSLQRIYAQVIDDANSITLVSVSSKEAKAKNNIEGAEKVGAALAKKCLGKNIKSVVFDRAGYKYHGKVKALAEAARKAGLVL